MEEKQRQLEERGVAVEKALRGEAGNDLSFIPSYIFVFLIWQIDTVPVFSELKVTFITHITLLLLLTFYK